MALKKNDERKQGKKQRKRTQPRPPKPMPDSFADVDAEKAAAKSAATVKARNDVNEAQAALVIANNAVRRALAYQGDFAVRERNVAEAQAQLAKARINASEKLRIYSELKLGR